MFLKNLKFNHYVSTELLTPKVLLWFALWTVALIGQAMFDWTMLRFLIQYAFHSWWLSVMLATCLVAALMMLDITVLTADTSDHSRKRMYAQVIGRVAFTVALAYVTSAPMEVSWFETEILARLNSDQKKDIDQIRKNATVQEKARVDSEMVEVTAQLAGDASATQGNASADINAYESQRAEMRQKMVDKETKNEERLDTIIKKKEQDSLDEAAGKGLSGKVKCADACKKAQAQADAAKAELAKSKTDSSAALIAFDDKTKDHLISLRAGRDKVTVSNHAELKNRMDALRKERKEKEDGLKVMDPAKLVDIYGGTYRTQWGWKDMKHTLDLLLAEDPSMAEAILICRILAAFAGFLIIMLALARPEEVSRFFSLGAQAQAGDRFAKKVVNGMGYDDLKNYALTSVARTNLEELSGCRFDVSAVRHELDERMVAIIVPNQVSGLYPTRLEVQADLHAIWVQKGQPAMKKLAEQEEKVRRAGQIVPAWPTEKLGKDPRVGNPWEVDERKLKSFGWQSPDDILEAAKQARKDLLANRLLLRKRTEEAEVDLQDLIAGNTRITLQQILASRRAFYKGQILPVLDSLRANEETIRISGSEPAQWPEDFSDPRPGLYQKICLPEESDLRIKYGWEGKDEPSGLRAVQSEA